MLGFERQIKVVIDHAAISIQARWCADWVAHPFDDYRYGATSEQRITIIGPVQRHLMSAKVIPLSHR